MSSEGWTGDVHFFLSQDSLSEDCLGDAWMPRAGMVSGAAVGGRSRWPPENNKFLLYDVACVVRLKLSAVNLCACLCVGVAFGLLLHVAHDERLAVKGAARVTAERPWRAESSLRIPRLQTRLGGREGRHSTCAIARSGARAMEPPPPCDQRRPR